MLAYQPTHGKKSVRTRKIAFLAVWAATLWDFSRVADLRYQPNSTDLRFVIDTLTFSCSLATIGRLEYSPPVKTSPWQDEPTRRTGHHWRNHAHLWTLWTKYFWQYCFFIYFCHDKNNKNNETYKEVWNLLVSGLINITITVVTWWQTDIMTVSLKRYHA